MAISAFPSLNKRTTQGYQVWLPVISLALLATAACAQESPPEAGLTLAVPTWEALPEPQFPSTATAAGVTEGTATLQCPLLRDGALGECRIAREAPHGLGFGQAAVEAAREARAAPPNPWTPGMEIGFTVRFEAAS